MQQWKKKIYLSDTVVKHNELQWKMKRLWGNGGSEFINWHHPEEAVRRHPLLKVQRRSCFFGTAAQRVLIVKPCVTAKMQSQQKKDRWLYQTHVPLKTCEPWAERKASQLLKKKGGVHGFSYMVSFIVKLILRLVGFGLLSVYLQLCPFTCFLIMNKLVL